MLNDYRDLISTAPFFDKRRPTIVVELYVQEEGPIMVANESCIVIKCLFQNKLENEGEKGIDPDSGVIDYHLLQTNHRIRFLIVKIFVKILMGSLVS